MNTVSQFALLSSIDYDVLALVHLIVNAFIGGICICRLGKMYGVIARVKIQYVAMTVAATANGFAPVFFQQWPVVVSVFFSATVLYMMWSDSYQWKRGAPKEAVKEVYAQDTVAEETSHDHA